MIDKIEALKALLENGQFHHATYRDFGKIWEGLNVYQRDANGFRGFSGPVIWFHLREDPELLKEAQALVAHRGTSLGAYGEG